MKQLCIGTILVLLALFWITSSVSANGQNEFDGRVGLGGIMIYSGNNLNPKGSEKNIDDLNSAADKELTVLPMILPEVTYDVGESEGLKLYFTTEPPIDEVGGFAFILGASYPIEGLVVFDMNAFFTPFEEVWKNPYITGIDRETTTTSKYGAKIAFNRIMGTGLRLNAVYMNDDVDDDIIGSLNPEMARDGAIYALNANYSFHLSKSFELRPRMSIRKGDYDGEANSFTKYKFDIEARNMVGHIMYISRIYYSYSGYDKTNPIFDKTRNNNGYGISLMTNYIAPFGFDNWSLIGLLSLSKGDSNIDFYDTEAITFGAFMTYNF